MCPTKEDVIHLVGMYQASEGVPTLRNMLKLQIKHLVDYHCTCEDNTCRDWYLNT